MVEFGNEICPMSTFGLSWDHVRTFNPLSRSRAAGGHAFPSPSSLTPLSCSLFPPPLPTSLLPPPPLSLSFLLLLLFVSSYSFLSSHSPLHAYPITLSYPFHVTIEIKRIDRVCTEKEARRTGKTLSTARTYDLFWREAPTRNIRYP